MNFLTALFLLLTADNTVEELLWPEPTDEINQLIGFMGDKKFKVREEAHKKLIENGFLALKAVRRGTFNQDPEIAKRCRDILDAYFRASPTTGDFPSIFKIEYELPVETYLHTELKLLSKKEAKKLYECFFSGMWLYHDEDIASEVTKWYTAKLLRHGVPKNTVIKILNAAQQRETDYPSQEEIE